MKKILIKTLIALVAISSVIKLSADEVTNNTLKNVASKAIPVENAWLKEKYERERVKPVKKAKKTENVFLFE